MTDTELRSLSDTNLNAHGGPRAPRDPLLEKDKRLEKVRHLLSFPCSGLQELAQSAGEGGASQRVRARGCRRSSPVAWYVSRSRSPRCSA